jgi:hypothetical protein
MNQIISIDETNRIARVQAGVINLDLDTAVKNLVWHIFQIQLAVIGQRWVEMQQRMQVECAV